MNLYNANSQWSSRPDDERFWSISEAYKATLEYANGAQELELDFDRERIEATEDGNLVLTCGNRQATMSNWAFGQLARIAGAPTQYLSKLPASLAAQCLETGLDEYFSRRNNMTSAALVHGGSTPVLRSLTSTKYTRIWNHEVFSKLLELEQHGWKVPPARPARHGASNTRRATEQDCLDARSSGGGLAVKPGDLIAPAGIYASDHDMFAFMVNEQNRLEDGSDGGLSRGFFVQNSEVGASALKVSCFNYRHVCGNHIVWGAENVVDVAIRHVGDVSERWQVSISAMQDYANSSALEEQNRIKRAQRHILGATKQDVLDAVFKAIIGNRKNGLPSGMNLKQLTGAYDLAVEHESTDGNPHSLWGYVNGLTRLSQSTAFADERHFLDKYASNLLALAV